jgi:acetyltransferase-like isoleucine patch superfamily enzyme
MQVTKAFLRGVGQFFSWIYPYKIYSLVSRFAFNYIYTGWVKNALKKCGSNPYICRPLFLHGGQFIQIGNNFRSERCLRLEAHQEHNGKHFNPQIKIGNDVSINFGCHIAAINLISIGNGVLIASNVFITDHYHGMAERDSLNIPPSLRLLESKGPVIIKDNVWIGEGVCIMPNVTIGEGCVVGANSVVTKSFPAHSVIGGVPAKVIKQSTLPI